MQQQTPTTQPRILLVEDDENIRHVYGAMLRHVGFQVIEARNGAEAVEHALVHEPDLVLMDVNLPTFDGWEAARRIKASPRTAAAPVIAFSALIESVADLRREAPPFDGFIAKPVSPSLLARRVNAYCDLLVRSTRQSRPTRRQPAGTSN